MAIAMSDHWNSCETAAEMTFIECEKEIFAMIYTYVLADVQVREPITSGLTSRSRRGGKLPMEGRWLKDEAGRRGKHSLDIYISKRKQKSERRCHVTFIAEVSGN